MTTTAAKKDRWQSIPKPNATYRATNRNHQKNDAVRIDRALPSEQCSLLENLPLKLALFGFQEFNSPVICTFWQTDMPTLRYLLFASWILGSFAPSALAETWSLPANISDSNTSVTFEVDSTFHLVQGKTSRISGSIKQADPADPLSISVDLSIPVDSFDTDWDSRDEKMLKVMAADIFKSVRFTSTKLNESCHPARLRQQRHCSGTLEGVLTIRDVSKPVSLPVEIFRDKDRDRISGKLVVLWAEYKVEDPSILIAKLHPSVSIAYSTEVPLR